MLNFPKICPHCQKEPVWAQLTVEDAYNFELPYIRLGLAPPVGSGGIATLINYRKCNICGNFAKSINSADQTPICPSAQL